MAKKIKEVSETTKVELNKKKKVDGKRIKEEIEKKEAIIKGGQTVRKDKKQ